MDNQRSADDSLVIDSVCGMKIRFGTAEQNDLYRDYKGERHCFCSLSCLQAFDMNPDRFCKIKDSESPIGHCELCAKIIQHNEEFAELNIHGTTFKFCCSTCASVFSSENKSNDQLAEFSVHNLEQFSDSVITQWLEEAVKQNASDLFLSVNEKPMLKIYGVFKRLEGASLSAEQLRRIVKEIIPEEKWTHFLEGDEVDVGIDIQGLSRFRVNVFQEQKGDAVAIRPIPQKIPTIENLRLPAVFHDLSRLSHGLILITGPAGSGKSATLAALIETINQREDRHIITIEDPIEYVIPSKHSLVHQREVGQHTSSFASGLRSALRENPDIIVVGELRDLESIALAVRAAETGHLVLGTLHSGTAIQAVTRVFDVFDTARQPQIRIQLAQSLQAICAQRLIKRCDQRGMIVATELLIATVAMRNIIRQNRIQELRGFMEFGKADGMYTLKQSIQELVDEGLVAPDALHEAEESELTRDKQENIGHKKHKF